MTPLASSPLRSADWLVAHQTDSDLRVLDCRFSLNDPVLGQRAYEAGHVTGAVYADLEAHLSGKVQPSGTGGRHPLPDPRNLADWLGENGIGNGNTVICYDDPSAGGGFYAARAWWLLRWLGHREVYVLGGGWPAYLAAGGEVRTTTPQHQPTRFIPDVQPDMVATAEDVQGRNPETALIDSRAPERYRGEAEPLDKKAGHIPGAVNRPFGAAFSPDGHYLPAEAQVARLAVGSAPTISYCGSGISATPNLLARELAGVPLGPHNRLYAGSWSDWISDDSRPLVTGEEETKTLPELRHKGSQDVS